MNIPLPRLIEGMIATMRSDVIPHVTDPYARGQAVGIIDLLNNLAPRLEWTHAPLSAVIREKEALLRDVAAIVPDIAVRTAQSGKDTADDLLVRKAALDAALADALAIAWTRRQEPECGRVVAAIKAHLHEEASAELKMTRKPLFAEIAGGKGGAEA